MPFELLQYAEAKAVPQDIRAYEQTQETLALLKILALGQREIAAGETRTASDVLDELSGQ